MVNMLKSRASAMALSTVIKTGRSVIGYLLRNIWYYRTRQKILPTDRQEMLYFQLSAKCPNVTEMIAIGGIQGAPHAAHRYRWQTYTRSNLFMYIAYTYHLILKVAYIWNELTNWNEIWLKRLSSSQESAFWGRIANESCLGFISLNMPIFVQMQKFQPSQYSRGTFEWLKMKKFQLITYVTFGS